MNNCLPLPFTLTPEELRIIDNRLEEFAELGKQDTDTWFSELCFCILTANSQAKKAIAIQQELGAQGFLTKSEQEIASIIRKHNHRFHNTKARYIVEARTYSNIKELLCGMSSYQAREFLVKNIKGLGYKEASHFLRNIGYHDVAIIDRHIIRFLVRYNFIKSEPKSLNARNYLHLENILKNFCLSLDKLDLILWYHMTGTVLK